MEGRALGFKMLSLVGLFFFPPKGLWFIWLRFQLCWIFWIMVVLPPFLWLWKPVSREYEVMVIDRHRTSRVSWDFFQDTVESRRLGLFGLP